MKLSEDHAKLSHPPLRRMSPLERSELFHIDALPRSRLPLESNSLTRSPIRIISSGNKLFTPKEKSPLLRPSAMQLGSAHSPSANVTSTLAKRSEPVPPGNFCPAAPPFMKDLSNQPLTSHIKKKPITKSRVFNSGSGNASSPRLELEKVQSSDLSSSVNPLRFHWQPLTSSLSTKSTHEVCRQLRCNPDTTTADLKGCQPSFKSPVTHSPAALFRDMQHKHPGTSENKNEAGDLKISKKRKKETDYDKPNKKSCVQHDCSASSLAARSLPECSAIPAMSPKNPKSHLGLEPLPGKTTHLASSNLSESPQTTCTRVSRDASIKTRPPMGAKQLFMKTSVNHTVKIADYFMQDTDQECSKKHLKEVHKPTKSLTSSSAGTPGDAGRSDHLQSSTPSSAQKHSSCLGLSAKTLGRNNQMEESRKSGSSHKYPRPNFSSPNSCSSELNKSARKRRLVAVPDSDDISNLFAPDPATFLVVAGQKLVKSTVVRETSKPTVKNIVSASVHSTSTARSLCHKTTNVTPAASKKGSSSSSEPKVQMFLPRICLERLKIISKGSKSLHLTSNKVNNSPEVTASPKALQDSTMETDRKQTPLPPDGGRPCTLETEHLSSQKKSSSSQSTLPKKPSSSQSTSPPERLANKKKRKRVTEEVASDVELDLDLSFSLDLDLSQSSHSSQDEEEEKLMSLQELMKPPAHSDPDTPEMRVTAEPNTLGHRSSKEKTEPSKESKPQPFSNLPTYKHNLDVMIKEKNTNNRYYEIKSHLLDKCQDDLLKIAEYEKAEETQEADISNEHQEFLQHYMLLPTAIKEVPPGEAVFNLEKFGCIFDRDTLQLNRCVNISQGAVRKILLTSSQTQLKLHLIIGMFNEVYESDPCPAEVALFLFKMMSVHDERTVSQKIFQTLHDIACTAAYHIVKNRDRQFKVWVPSLADVALVLMNMGAAFVSLFPFENLQPPFTEGDLLGDASLKSESQRKTEKRSFPEANYNNVLKYLRLCMTLCPRAYSDDELLVLLTMLGKVSLDSSLVLQTGMELDTLLGKIFHNITEWDAMLPKICRALVDLTEDHHNMCLLVKLLPHDKCGTQLRRQLCLSMISKLLDGRCTYTPTDDMLTLSKLRLYLPRMQPATLLHTVMSSAGRDDQSNLDEQAYYVCYSLLTLVKEASNFQSCPPQQKEELLCLCSELETHVKCHIRENEKCLYRTRVKDLVARIDIKWQILLHGTKPLDNQIYHYWKPPPADVLQEELDSASSDSEDEGGTEEMGSTEGNEAAAVSEDEEIESKTEAGSNQNGLPVGENVTDDLHENKMTGVECGINLDMPDPTVIPRKLEEKHDER